jgi:hypothetical protein
VLRLTHCCNVCRYVQVLKGSHTYPLLPKRSEGKGVKEISDRSGAETENVLGTHIDLDIDESDAESIPLNAGTVLHHLDAASRTQRLLWR